MGACIPFGERGPWTPICRLVIMERGGEVKGGGDREGWSGRGRCVGGGGGGAGKLVPHSNP